MSEWELRGNRMMTGKLWGLERAGWPHPPQNQCPHPVPTNHTGCLKVLLQRVVILWGLSGHWFVLFETGFHYVFRAGLELIIYPKLASGSQRSIAISLLSTEVIGTSYHT